MRQNVESKVYGAMDDSSRENQAYELWRLLSKVRRVIFKVRERELSRYDITPEQCGVLYIIKHADEPPSQSYISRIMMIEPHTMSGLVKRMELKGLLKRERNPRRKNVTRIMITEKGEEAYKISMAKKESISNIMLGLSEEELEQLSVHLNKIFERATIALEKTYKSPLSIPDSMPD
ncbi:MarR family winged helix-turn-helix transcriptional regulator [Chloroflexota bacterium]